jgi:hypothetical protein
MALLVAHAASGSVVFLLTATFILTKTGRDAVLSVDGGVSQLPVAYLGIAVALPAAKAR